MNMACNPMEAVLDPAGCVGQAVESVVGDAIDNMANAVVKAFGEAIASLGTVWVHIGTPNLTSTGGTSSVSAGDMAPGTAYRIERLLGMVTWISLAVAVISLFILGAMVATRMRRGEGIAAVGKAGLILAGVVLISGASALVSKVLPAGPTNAGGAVAFLQSGLWWLTGALAVVSVILGGARMVWEQRAEPGRDLLKSLLTLVVVAGAGVTIVGLLVAAADSFSVWLLNTSTDCDITAPGGACFGQNLLTLVAFSQATGLGSLLIIILGLIAVLASVFQIVLMVARGAMLVILTGVLPLSAAFTNTEMGKNWFRKCLSWLVAFILYKPAAAIIYAAAFQLAGTDVFSDDGTGLLAVLTGLTLMVLALFAMPALMRFVTPMVGAMAGGAGGAALATGALAALPTGAAAVGKLASGAKDSGGGTGQQGQPGNSGPTGTGSGTGNHGPGGAQIAGPQPNGSPQTSGAPTTGAATQGAPAAASAGSTGGAAASGAASAGGGAAGGPVGMAAGAALDVAKAAGQAAAGAARQVGQEATGEGGGPDGSR